MPRGALRGRCERPQAELKARASPLDLEVSAARAVLVVRHHHAEAVRRDVCAGGLPTALCVVAGCEAHVCAHAQVERHHRLHGRRRRAQASAAAADGNAAADGSASGLAAQLLLVLPLVLLLPELSEKISSKRPCTSYGTSYRDSPGLGQ